MMGDMPIIANIEKSDIVICGFNEIEEVVKTHGITHVVSIRDEDLPTPTAVEPLQHLRLHFEDIVDPEDPGSPDIQHIRLLLAQGIVLLNAAKLAERPLLVHCEAGMCRSAAAALLLFTEALGASSESARTAMRWILDIREPADPNVLMCKLGDRVFGSDFITTAASEVEEEINRRFMIRHDLYNENDWV